MSVVADNTSITLTGEQFGRQYAVRQLDTLAPVTTRKMRFAYRASISGAGLATATNLYKTMSCFGLRFNATKLGMPYPLVPDTGFGAGDNYNDPAAGASWADADINNFFGWLSTWGFKYDGGIGYFSPSVGYKMCHMETADHDAITFRSLWGGYTAGSTDRQRGFFMRGAADRTLIDEDEVASAHNGKLSSETIAAEDIWGCFPDSTDYANVTMGWELSANALNKEIMYRLVWDAVGHSTSNLLDVFDNASLPTTGEQTERLFTDVASPFRPDNDTYTWPSYLHIANGHPTAVMALSKYSVAYYDINDEVIVA